MRKFTIIVRTMRGVWEPAEGPHPGGPREVRKLLPQGVTSDGVSNGGWGLTLE